MDLFPMNTICWLALLALLCGSVRLSIWRRVCGAKRLSGRAVDAESGRRSAPQDLRDLDLRLAEAFLLFSLLTLGLVMGLSSASATGRFHTLETRILPTLLLLLIAGSAARVVRLLSARRSYQLVLSGERILDEQLNQLQAQNCHVFHDFPALGFGNIDHIVVGPAGVFAIETKARPGFGKVLPGRRDHQVAFDGRALHFPDGADEHNLDQTERNANWLGDYLERAIGERVKVVPILTLPGWYIDREVKGGIPVLNEKEVRGHILHCREGKLSPQSVQRIVHQLDHDRRHVEP